MPTQGEVIVNARFNLKSAENDLKTLEAKSASAAKKIADNMKAVSKNLEIKVSLAKEFENAQNALERTKSKIAEIHRELDDMDITHTWGNFTDWDEEFDNHRQTLLKSLDVMHDLKMEQEEYVTNIQKRLRANAADSEMLKTSRDALNNRQAEYQEHIATLKEVISENKTVVSEEERRLEIEKETARQAQITAAQAKANAEMRKAANTEEISNLKLAEQRAKTEKAVAAAAKATQKAQAEQAQAAGAAEDATKHQAELQQLIADAASGKTTGKVATEEAQAYFEQENAVKRVKAAEIAARNEKGKSARLAQQQADEERRVAESAKLTEMYEQRSASIEAEQVREVQAITAAVDERVTAARQAAQASQEEARATQAVVEKNLTLEQAKGKLAGVYDNLKNIRSAMTVNGRETNTIAGQLEKARDKAAKTQAEITKLEKKLTDAAHAAQQSGIETGKYGSASEAVAKSVGAIARENSKDYEKLAALRAEYDSLKQTIEELTGKYELLIQQKERLTTENGTNSQMVQQLEEQVTAQRKTVEVSKEAEESAQRIVNVMAKAASEIKQKLVGALKTAAGWMKKLGKMTLDITGISAFSDRVKGLTNGFKQLERMMFRTIARGVLFSAVSSALSKLRSYVVDTMGTMTQFNAAFANLGGAASNAANILLQVLEPTLVAIANAAAMVFNYIAKLLTFFTGKTSQAAKVATGAAGSASKAAKELKRSLAGFDEIEKLADNKDTSSGGGGGGSSGIDPNLGYDSVNDFLQDVIDAIKDGDWAKAGKLLAEKLNSVIDAWDAGAWGKKVGKAINNVVELLYNFVYNVNWNNLGVKLAEAFNEIVGQINWWEVGGLLVAGMTISIRILGSFLENVGYVELGNSIAEMIMGACHHVLGALHSINFTAIGEGIATSINTVIDRVPPALIGHTIGKLLGSAVEVAVSTINNVHWDTVIPWVVEVATTILSDINDELEKLDWNELIEEIKTGIGNSDWDGLWTEIKRLLGNLEPVLKLWAEVTFIPMMLKFLAGDLLFNALKKAMVNKISSAITAALTGTEVAGAATLGASGIMTSIGEIFTGWVFPVAAITLPVVLAFNKTKDALDMSASELEQNLSDHYEDIVAQVNGNGENLTGIVESNTGTMSKIAKDALDGTETELNTKSGIYQSVWSILWDNIKTTVLGTTDEVETDVVTMTGGVETSIQSISTDMTPVWTEFWANLFGTTDTTTTGIETDVDTMNVGIGTGISVLNTDYLPIWSEFWTFMQGAVSDGAANIEADTAAMQIGVETPINGINDNMTPLWAEFWENMKEEAKTKTSEIKTGAEQFGKDVKTNFVSWTTEVKNDWTNKMNALITMGNTMQTRVSSAFNTLKNNVCGYFNTMRSSISGAVNDIINTINNMLRSIGNGINAAIDVLNSFSFDIPDWLPEIGGRTFGLSIPHISVPQLAQGAVIPANHEFLAVLGDQKHGTNIEAPLDTIKQAVAEVMGDMQNRQDEGFETTVDALRDILQAIYGIEIGDATIGQAANRYNTRRSIMVGG